MSEKIALQNAQCPYCSFKEDKFGSLCGKPKLEEDNPFEDNYAQLNIFGSSKRNPVPHPVLEIQTDDGIYIDFGVSNCPWCGRKLISDEV